MNELSRRQLTTIPAKLWVCQICGRIRACPYEALPLPVLVKYVGCCLCGDVCLNDAEDSKGKLAGVIVTSCCESTNNQTDIPSRASLAACESKYGQHAAGHLFSEAARASPENRDTRTLTSTEGG